MAIRTYFESPAAADTWIESALDIRDRRGNALPGYGWIFPLGDGSINAGIGLLSTFRDYKNVNTSWLMDEWAHALPDYWQIDPTAPEIPPVGGRLPMGGSVSPKAGPNWLVVGMLPAPSTPLTEKASTMPMRPAEPPPTSRWLPQQRHNPNPVGRRLPNLAGRHL